MLIPFVVGLWLEWSRMQYVFQVSETYANKHRHNFENNRKHCNNANQLLLNLLSLFIVSIMYGNKSGHHF